MRIIRYSERDHLALAGLQNESMEPPLRSDSDFLNRSIVLKPWGYEYLLAGNPEVAVWLLSLKVGQSTSLHCHCRKRTILIVVEGQVLVESLGVQESHSAGAVIEIEAGAFHRSSNLGVSNAVIIEIETPNDKYDLVRLSDGYGRVGSGYEEVGVLQEDLVNHDWVRIDDLRTQQIVEKFVGRASLRLFAGANLMYLSETVNQFDVLVSLRRDAPILVGKEIENIVNVSNSYWRSSVVLGLSWRDSRRPLSFVVANALAEAGVKDVFASVGDSNGHLVESVARHESLRLRVFADERQAGNAAQGLARFNGVATALLPGSAYGLGCATSVFLDCWVDSVPLVMISTSSPSIEIPISDGVVKQPTSLNKAIDGLRLLGSATKVAIRVSGDSTEPSLGFLISDAVRVANSDPKGPVLVEVDRRELTRLIAIS